MKQIRSSKTSQVKSFEIGIFNNSNEHTIPICIPNSKRKVDPIDSSVIGQCFKELIQEKLFSKVISFDRRKFAKMNNNRYNEDGRLAKQLRDKQFKKTNQKYSLNHSPDQKFYQSRDLSSQRTGQGFLTSAIQYKSTMLSAKRNKKRNISFFNNINQATNRYQSLDMDKLPKNQFITKMNQQAQLYSPAIRSQFSRNKHKRILNKLKESDDFFDLSKKIMQLPDIIESPLRNCRVSKMKKENKHIVDHLIWKVVSKNNKGQKTSTLFLNAEQKKQGVKRLFNYQGYLQYMNYACNASEFYQSFLDFFQPSGIKQGVNRKIYQNYLLELSKTKSQLWSVFLFRFLDKQHKGYLQTKDLFLRFTKLNQFDYDSQNKNLIVPKDFQNNFSEEIMFLLKQKRALFREVMIKQINRLSDIIINKQKVRKQYTQQELKQKAFRKKQNIQNSQAFMMKNIEEIFLKKNHATACDVSYLLGGSQDSSKEQDSNKGSILTSKSRVSPKKSAIQSKNPTLIKQACCYRQCFIATQHNEQTRLRRQKIENARDEIKQSRLNRNQNLEYISLSYEQFVNSQDGHHPESVIQDLVLQLHGFKKKGNIFLSQMDYLSGYS